MTSTLFVVLALYFDGEPSEEPPNRATPNCHIQDSSFQPSSTMSSAVIFTS